MSHWELEDQIRGNAELGETAILLRSDLPQTGLEADLAEIKKALRAHCLGEVDQADWEWIVLAAREGWEGEAGQEVVRNMLCQARSQPEMSAIVLAQRPVEAVKTINPDGTLGPDIWSAVEVSFPVVLRASVFQALSRDGQPQPVNLVNDLLGYVKQVSYLHTDDLVGLESLGSN